MTREQAEQDIVAGYLDGLDPACPIPCWRRSQSYCHGFRVGRGERSNAHAFPTVEAAVMAAEQAITADSTLYFH